jgi:hypothetical protein
VGHVLRAGIVRAKGGEGTGRGRVAEARDAQAAKGGGRGRIKGGAIERVVNGHSRGGENLASVGNLQRLYLS